MVATDGTGPEPQVKRKRAEADLFVLTIRATPPGRDKHGRDARYRLKRLLKTMLRSWGWRCVSLKPRWLDEQESQET